jgi:Immunoglobulin domain
MAFTMRTSSSSSFYPYTTLSTNFSGEPFFQYQWQLNGSNLVNATSAAYTIATVGTNDAGYYAVVVTNAAGSATSSNAVLAVVLSPTSRTNYASSTATFTAAGFSPEALNYQWQKNGTNLVEGGRLSGTTNSMLTIAGVSDADAASYSAVVSDASGSVTTFGAVLTVIDPPAITAQPTNLLVLAGTNAAFGVALSGTAPFRYQWRFNGTNLINATNALFSIPSVGTNSAGNYAVVVTNAAGSAASSNAALTVVLSPKSRTNYASTTATFTATAFSPESLNYQWQKNGTNLVEGGGLSGTTNSTLTIASVSAADAASYRAVVSDASGSVTTSNAVLTVIDPPLVTAQPTNLLVLPGTNAVFGVSLSGTAPLRYQWRFNGTDLLNATNATYAIPTVGKNNAGNYAVVITNAAGSATSSNAALTVVLSPKSRTNYASSTATFTATAFSPQSLNYQWQKNGTNLANSGRLSGSTNSTLTIANVSDADAARYSAVVSDTYGSVTTSNAVLTVNDSLVIAAQPQSQTVGLGSNVTFSACAEINSGLFLGTECNSIRAERCA